MKWLPWRRRRPHRCLGVRLRISVPDGPLVDATSDQLYLIAKYGGAGEDGWYELLSGGGPSGSIMGGDMLISNLSTGLRIEIQCHATT